jgi:hypothetical protein
MEIREEKHDGFGTLNGKNHQSYLFSNTRPSRISHHSHHTPTFLSKRRYPFTTYSNIYVVT